MNTKRMKLAEEQEPERLVHFRTRQKHVVDRRLSPVTRPKFGGRFDLGAKIRRRVQQGPLLRNVSRSAVPSKLSLCACSPIKLAGAQPAAVWARAVPLRESTTRSTAENSYLHVKGD